MAAYETGIERVLISSEEIQARVAELGAQITKEYDGKTPLIVGMLRGAVMFMGDLLKHIKIPCNIDFLCLSSYCGTTSTGEVRTLLDLRDGIEGRHIIIVEDIVDTGLTLSFVLKNLRARGAASVEVCSLLDKPTNRKALVTAKYTGFSIPDEFVVGYGLDYNELYRNLPYIGVYKQK